MIFFREKEARLGGRRFFGDELRQANYIHFLKAYALWIAIVRLKREVVESVYNIKFLKNRFVHKTRRLKNIFSKSIYILIFLGIGLRK